MYSIPPRLEPISNGLGFRGWRWSTYRDLSSTQPTDRVAILRRLTPWDLSVPWRGGRISLRQQIDQLLADPSQNPSAFLILTDYFDLLNDQAPNLADHQPLARFRLDERVDDFSCFHRNSFEPSHYVEPIRDALFYIGGNLPPGAFAGTVALLDQLLADVRHRRHYPTSSHDWQTRASPGAKNCLPSSIRLGPPVTASSPGAGTVNLPLRVFAPWLLRSLNFGPGCPPSARSIPMSLFSGVFGGEACS